MITINHNISLHIKYLMASFVVKKKIIFKELYFQLREAKI